MEKDNGACKREAGGDGTDCTNETDIHNGEVKGGESNREVSVDGIEGRNATNVNVQEDNCGAYKGEVSGDEFGGTNAPNVHNGEVGDDEIEDFNFRKEMAYKNGRK